MMAPAMLPSPTGLASRPAPPPPPPPSNRFRRDPRLAPLYERDIAPVWTQPFGRLLLQQVAPLGNIRNIDFVAIVGGSGLDFEISQMLMHKLAEFGTVIGTANIQARLGPVNAVATGLVLGYLQRAGQR